MKKFLLSFLFIAGYFLSFAQTPISFPSDAVKMNEFYVRPNMNNASGNMEYFELYNPTGSSINLDCYTLVTFFDNGQTGTAHSWGYIVIDLPNVNLAPNSFYVAAAGDNSLPKVGNNYQFNYQSAPPYGQAQFNWNDVDNSNLDANPNNDFSDAKVYFYDNNAVKINPNGSPLTPERQNDIFLESPLKGGNKSYTFLLFRGNELVDALLGADNKGTLPNPIYDLSSFTHQIKHAPSNNCNDLNYILSNFQDKILAHVNASAGTDNGYTRECGDVWEKSSSPSEHTPGTANKNQIFLSNTLNFDLDCTPTTVTYYAFGSSSDFPVNVTVYYDNNRNFALDNNDPVASTNTFTATGQSKTFNKTNAMLNDPNPGFFIRVVGACNNNTTIYFSCTGEIILPVNLKNFNATRKAGSVELSWETAMEVNNKGFYVQRNTGSGNWETVNFVASKAQSGNSTNALSYSFTDANTNKVVTQYRLLQEDRDGKGQYSEIRSVRGMEQLSKVIVYPNPSKDGVVNIVFDDATGTRNIIVSDMTGRIVQQFKNISSSSLQIQNLMTGLYNIKILNLQTGKQNIERASIVR